jgi:hypothetical protein
METPPEFDLQVAHRYFAALCFNRCWDLMDKPHRTSDDDAEMVRLSLASHWHWTQVETHTAKNLSIGYWQTSRVFALLGHADSARQYAQRCLRVSGEDQVEPFYRGYALEALARAAALAGDGEATEQFLRHARQQAERVDDESSRNGLLSDLDSIQVAQHDDSAEP